MCDTCNQLLELLNIERGKNFILRQIVEHHLNMKFEESSVCKRPRIVIDTESEVKTKVDTKEVNEEDEVKMVIINDSNDAIAEAFESLKEARNYMNILSRIKQQRISEMQLVMSPLEYTSKVLEHIAQTKETLKDKGWTEKKMLSVIQKFVSPLEAFITHTQGYEKQIIEIDEITQFRNCCIHAAKNDSVLSIQHFTQFFTSHVLTMYTLAELIEIYVKESSTIIFVPKKKADYTFYSLNEIKDDKKFWKMDCRLEYLTQDLSYCVVQYSKNLFKTIYKECLKTNAYFPDYASRFQILEYQCGQLLQNMFLAMDFVKLNRVFREAVQKHATYTSTINDVFDMSSDEAEQDLENHGMTKEDKMMVMSEMFEGSIHSDDAEKFFQSLYMQ
jgi:hypothetical protein